MAFKYKRRRAAVRLVDDVGRRPDDCGKDNRAFTSGVKDENGNPIIWNRGEILVGTILGDSGKFIPDGYDFYIYSRTYHRSNDGDAVWLEVSPLEALANQFGEI